MDAVKRVMTRMIRFKKYCNRNWTVCQAEIREALIKSTGAKMGLKNILLIIDVGKMLHFLIQKIVAIS